jgi:hypothetical protein
VRAAISLAKVYDGVIASNNLKDIAKYIIYPITLLVFLFFRQDMLKKGVGLFLPKQAIR